ncbi:MAG: S8 family serine peptidase [Chloroflexi bacterium]|nr:S8 family serine peptidase [Chloroflexota bacterium]
MSGMASAAANSVPAAGVIPGQYIVVFNDTVANPRDAANDMAREHGLGLTHVYEYAVKGYAATIPAARLNAVKSDSRVLFVSEDREVSIGAQTLPTGVDRIDAEQTATHTNKGTGVNVAVIDTGIDLTHPDLSANIVGGKNCSTGKSYSDGNGHGSHVAGTIAAVNNTEGVVGIAPEAKLWAVRVLDNRGSGSWSSVICGIDFVTSKAPANGGPITVANMSLGGTGSDDGNCGLTNNDALHQAICRSVAAGVTYVVAAGNETDNAANHVPAAYDEVITVSALSDSDGKSGGTGGAPTCRTGELDDYFATFSNFGADVDIAAPGVCILSTWKGGGYNTISGTSMASPHVAGVAALYIATHAGATPAQVKDALIAAQESGPIPGDPDTYKEGIVNAGGF